MSPGRRWAPVSGSAFFAWDNVNSLGANVTSVGLPVPAEAVIPEPSTALLALAVRRRRQA